MQRMTITTPTRHWTCHSLSRTSKLLKRTGSTGMDSMKTIFRQSTDLTQTPEKGIVPIGEIGKTSKSRSLTDLQWPRGDHQRFFRFKFKILWVNVDPFKLLTVQLSTPSLYRHLLYIFKITRSPKCIWLQRQLCLHHTPAPDSHRAKESEIIEDWNAEIGQELHRPPGCHTPDRWIG